ncbi:MAG: hypothetical protein V3575_01490 [Candidatus Absconditabacteria bacterium]
MLYVFNIYSYSIIIMIYVLGIFDFLFTFAEYLQGFNKSVVVFVFGGVSLLIGFFLLKFGLRKVSEDINDGVGVFSIFFACLYLLFIAGVIIAHFFDQITALLGRVF